MTVVDRGFSSDENLRYLTRAGGHWIAGERMRDGSPDAAAALARQGRSIEADAALKSLRAELEPVDNDDDDDGIVPEGCAAPQPALKLAEPRSGPTPKRVASNATAVSRTDPDAKLRHKPGHRKHLVHRGQVAVDPKARGDRRGAGRACDRQRG